jgi:hypothetical protein
MQSVDAEGFFDVIRTQVAIAERAADKVLERWFEIAGLTLRLRFFGTTLEPYVAPALSHLEIGELRGAADLTLHCWDCASLGTEFPRAPVAMGAFTPRGEIHGLNNRRFHAAFEPGGRQLSLFDARLRQAVYCVGAAAGIPRFEIAEPIRTILSWFMRENGRQLIHAAAVGEPEGGVLLIGRSGAGKSNTALGCLASRLRYAADDFCAVSADANPKVYSLYCTGKTHAVDWDRHPFLTTLSPNLDPQRCEKAIYFLSQSCPQKLISEFPLRAILLPRRDGVSCDIRPISPATALHLAAPDTATLLPDAGSEVMRCIAQLVRTVPCYELLLGSVPEEITGVISRLLASGVQSATALSGEPKWHRKYSMLSNG